MPIPTNRGRLGYDAKEVSDEVSVYTGDKSLVQQHFKDEVDVNTIVRRFGITAGMPFGPDGGMYGDFTGIVDYESAVALIKDTESRFMRIPAELREKFNNNPGMLVRFAQDSSAEEFEAFFRPAEPGPVVPVVAPVVSPVVSSSPAS